MDRNPRASGHGAGHYADDLLPAPDQRAGPEAEADEARLWSERIERSHAGDGDYSMLRSLLADLPRVRTPWEQVLRTQLARGLAQKAGLSWSRPARSYIANQGRGGPNRRCPSSQAAACAQAGAAPRRDRRCLGVDRE